MGKQTQYEDAPETVYDRPSEKYPSLKEIGIGRGAQRVIETALSMMREASLAKKEADKIIATQYAIVQRALIAQGVELPCALWCGTPWTIYQGGTKQLSKERLLELGVSAEIIEKATIESMNSKWTVRSLEQRERKEKE